MEYIDGSAFLGCHSLKNINIPAGVKLGRDVVSENTTLTIIRIEEIAEDKDGCRIDENGVMIKYVGEGGTVRVPQGVTKIADRAFWECESVTEVILAEGVKSIGKNAFWNCVNLKTIRIPEGVTEIGECAFEYCDSLTEVILPDSAVNIGRGAFADCENLKCVTLSQKAEITKAIPRGITVIRK